MFDRAKILRASIVMIFVAVLVGCGTAADPTPASNSQAATPSSPSGETQSVPTATPAAQSAPSSSAPSGTLRIALDEIGPARWIPKLQGAPQNSINNTTFTDSLWSKGSDGTISGVLLDTWSVSEDGTKWTLNFKQGIPFHYGYGEFTAKDFIWTMENATEEGTLESQAENFRRIFFAEGGGIELVDDYTVIVNTVKPVPDFNWQLVLAINTQMGKGIFSKAYFEDVGPAEAGNKQAVGTGPWRSISHETGGTWKFEAVEDHWRKTPNFEELHYVEIGEESTRLANFQSGLLDSAKFNLDSVGVLKDSCPTCKFMTSVGGELFINIHGQMYVDRPDLATPRRLDLPWISPNPDINSPEWDRARKVRLAMNMAIDRELLVETLLQGQGAPVHVFGWLGHETRMGELATLKYEYNPERAMELLAEADYPDGFEINMALTNRPYPGTIETAEAVAIMWEEIGIRTVQSRQPMSSFRATFPERSWIGVNSHGTSPGPEPVERFNSFRPTSAVNYGLEHDIITNLYNTGVTTMDEDQRFEIARQMSKFLFDNAISIPTVSVFQVWPVGPDIDEWELLCCNTRVLTRTEYIPHRQ
jgi:peptide/nickel transport system substrate-binding protein